MRKLLTAPLISALVDSALAANQVHNQSRALEHGQQQHARNLVEYENHTEERNL